MSIFHLGNEASALKARKPVEAPTAGNEASALKARKPVGAATADLDLELEPHLYRIYIYIY